MLHTILCYIPDGVYSVHKILANVLALDGAGCVQIFLSEVLQPDTIIININFPDPWEKIPGFGGSRAAAASPL